MMRNTSRTVLFITGAFVSNSCWDEWQAYFREKGFTTHAPAWPFKDAPAAILRERHPDAQVASLRLTRLVAHYEAIAKAFPEKPILIGHSMGGLIAQLLLQKGLGTTAIAIHSVPPQGIFTFKLSFLIAGWGPLGFFTSTKKTFKMSFKQWQYGFANGMPPEWQQQHFEMTIPESKLIVRDTITAAAKIDFKRPHAPLLFIAGSIDRSIPSSLNYDNYRKYSDSNSVTAYKEFEGSNHMVLAQPHWQEIADYILGWI